MLEKYLSHTKKEGDCLEWTRCLNSDGYARAGNKLTNNIKVHREVFFLTHGFYPEVVRHTCDNTKCINPDHLLAGDPVSNAQDRHARNRTAGQVTDVEYDAVKRLLSFGYQQSDIVSALKMRQRRVEYIISKVRKAG